ncbi:MAG: hypothetical protein ACYDGR_10360 [Candidatus Dormibacteria bacterium]
MSYGNSTPPDPDAPVAPPELIGASLLLGAVAVLAISQQGAYLVRLLVELSSLHIPDRLDYAAIAAITLNTAGFAASLWYLALRRWAWGLGIAYAATEIVLRVYFSIQSIRPGFMRPGVDGPPHFIPAVGQGVLALLFLFVMLYMLGNDSRQLLSLREAYRARKAAAEAATQV